VKTLHCIVSEGSRRRYSASSFQQIGLPGRSRWINARRKGAGLGLPFAVALSESTSVPGGLIPCAHGGTSMDEWSPALRDKGGNSLYGAMYQRFQAASGKVTGILWYQGESDASAKDAPQFRKKFEDLIAAVRRDFNDPDLPFYGVQIGRHVSKGLAEPWNLVQQEQRLAAVRSEIDPREPAVVRLYLDNNPPPGAIVRYGYGRDPYCNLADERGFAVPVFGPFALPQETAK
jgi:hypothetical protein